MLALLLLLVPVLAPAAADAGKRAAFAPDVEWTAWFQSTYRQATKRHPPMSARQRLWAEATVKGMGPLTAFVSGYAQGDFSVSTRDSDEEAALAEVNEAYLMLNTDLFDVVMGLQQIRWGDADSMSTVDIINPVDYREPIATARSTQRLSVPAVDLRSNTPLGLVDLVFVPWPRFSRMAEHGSVWEPKDLKLLRDLDSAGYVRYREDDGVKAPEYGARLKMFRKGFDLALIFYHGYEHTPLYTWSMPEGQGAPVIEETYRTFETMALSSSISLDESTLRLEAAFKNGYPFQGDDLDIHRRNDFQFLGGWERYFFTNVLVNVQGFLFHHDGSGDVPGIDRSRYGASFNVEDKFFEEALRSGIRGVYYMNNSDLCLEWFNEYDYDDNWKLNFGYMHFAGKSDGTLGQFSQNSHFYVGIKYFF